MELITTNNLNQLPEGLRPYAFARVGQQAIKRLSEAEVKQLCGRVIATAYAESGQTGVSSEMLAFQIKTLIDELKGEFLTLTSVEVENAFKMGVRSELGQYFGLCAKTYHQFLKNYYHLPQRIESMKLFLQITNRVELVKAAPTEEEKAEIIKNAAVNAFIEYKETKRMPFVCAPIYDFLKDKGLINWTESEKNEIQKEVKEKYIDEMKQRRVSGHLSGTQYQNIVNNLGGGKNQALINRIKNHALKLYFNRLIELKKNLEIC